MIQSALYDSGFTINKAPVTLKDALDRYDIERANTKFGFAKDQNYTTAPTTTADVKPAVATVQPVAWQRNPPLASAASSSTTSTSTTTRRILPPSAPQAQGQSPALHQLHKQPDAHQQHQNKQQQQQQQQQYPGSAASSSAPLIHPTQPPPTGAMPPPTPTDSLRHSGLFSFPDTTNLNHNHNNSGLHRPKSSHGRSSLGPDARPIPPPPLVTPTNAAAAAAAASSSTRAGTKRPASQSITNNHHHSHLAVDPTATKKMATSNPYGKF